MMHLNFTLKISSQLQKPLEYLIYRSDTLGFVILALKCIKAQLTHKTDLNKTC